MQYTKEHAEAKSLATVYSRIKRDLNMIMDLNSTRDQSGLLTDSEIELIAMTAKILYDKAEKLRG